MFPLYLTGLPGILEVAIIAALIGALLMWDKFPTIAKASGNLVGVVQEGIRKLRTFR